MITYSQILTEGLFKSLVLPLGLMTASGALLAGSSFLGATSGLSDTSSTLDFMKNHPELKGNDLSLALQNNTSNIKLPINRDGTFSKIFHLDPNKFSVITNKDGDVISSRYNTNSMVSNNTINNMRTAGFGLGVGAVGARVLAMPDQVKSFNIQQQRQQQMQHEVNKYNQENPDFVQQQQQQQLQKQSQNLT